MSKILIGIDPGVNTGMAIVKDGKLCFCGTGYIHDVMDFIKRDYAWHPGLLVVVEDARKRSGRPEAAQGAGSVKRDCKIWEDYLTSLKISFKMVPPRKNGTKFRDQIFKASYPYWTKRTSEHGRSAANLLI